MKKHSPTKVAEDLARGFRLERKAAEAALLDVATQLWTSIDTPTSLGLALCVRHGDLRSVLEHSVHPKDYTSPEAFSLDYQAVSLLKKCPLPAVTLGERTKVALEKAILAEDQCSRTNARFLSRVRSGSSNSDVEAVLFSAQRKISNWLGEFSPDEWKSSCRFGPGADDLAHGKHTGAYHKLSALSSTEEFADGALALALDHPAWARSLAGVDPFELDEEGNLLVERELTIRQEFAPGNKVVFVPKSGLTERSIAIEPRANVYAQLGLGAMIRTRLKRVGLDLNTQDPNQDLAFDASRHGHLATIDLSSASDTLAYEVVRDLLPNEWFFALNWCRSARGIWPDGTVRPYHKFSSMGNGYTFELESMIFYALALACVERLGQVNWYTRVYGDDIICPVGAVALLEEVIEYCGFTVNRQKSFVSGVFRESCGADFFDGTNVRPYFCKEVPSNAQALFSLANGLRRAAHRAGRSFFCDRRYKPAWLNTVCRIPRPLRTLLEPVVVNERPWGTDTGGGDGGLITNHDEALSVQNVRFNRAFQRGWLHWRLENKAATYRGITDPGLLYAYALYRGRDGTPEGLLSGVITGRGSDGVRLNSRAYTLDFGSLGPWI